MRYGNARHPARDTPAPAPTGPVVGGNAHPTMVTLLGPDPIGAALPRRLFFMTSLVSPAASGRFRRGDKGSAESGNRWGYDIGPLQDFRGRGLIGRGITSRLGAQAGPSSQPAYPSTGTTTAPSIRSALSGMDMPRVLRSPL
jgi:hypothetical protein